MGLSLLAGEAQPTTDGKPGKEAVLRSQDAEPARSDTEPRSQEVSGGTDRVPPHGIAVGTFHNSCSRNSSLTEIV